MKILIQKEFEDLLKPIISDVSNIALGYGHEAGGDVAIGQYGFLAAIANKENYKYLILISEHQQLQINELRDINPFYVTKPAELDIIKIQLEVIREKIDKNLKASLVAKEIQKKRKELELLNDELFSESEIQFSSLEESNSDEMHKNLNEKS